MTRHEAVRLGVGLKNVMMAPGFAAAIEVLQHEYRQRVFESNPHEKEHREFAYQEARSLDSLLSTLNSFVAVAEHEALLSLVDPDEEDELINFDI